MTTGKVVLMFLMLFFFSSFGLSQEIFMENAVLVGGPCQGCEAIFEFGNRSLSPVDTLPDFKQADEKLKVTGTIYLPDGKTPAEGVIFYIYHTNAKGVYPTRGDETGWGRRHGYLRGWIRTGADGRYSFYTQKPGSYNQNPAHIHPLILEPDGKYYFIAEYRFRGDPHLKNGGGNRGGPGVVELKQADNMLIAKRNIILGLNIPDYD